MKRDLDLFEKLLPAIQKRDKLNRLIQNYYASDNKLLPVIITGSNTSLTQAFLLALQQTLKENDLLNIMPDTNYKAAVSVIERWKNDFPDTYQQFKNKITDSISSFVSRLEDYDIKAYEEFERIYPSLTAGSTFNPFVGFDVVQLYESVVQALKPHGYTGIYVIYDEFSKYLEANISEASVSDTKMLQDFAEKCNRSGKNQMHLMLISHKEIANYIDRLPKQKVDGWRGVSERFTHIHLNNNFTQTYEIIATVIQKNQKLWNLFCTEHKKEFNALARRYETHRIFSDMQADSVEHTIAACYPLHPVSTFILPRLSERVAQNERTLFTFLSANGQATLPSFLKQYHDSEFSVVTPDLIYDYFEPLFKKEISNGTLHDIYFLTSTILNQLDDDSLEEKLVKTLSLIYMLEQFEKLNSNGEKEAFDVVSKELSDSADIFKKMGKELQIVIPRKGAYERFSLSEDIVRYLVLSLVRPGKKMTFDSFLQVLYDHYGIVIGAAQYAQLKENVEPGMGGYFDENQIQFQMFLKNCGLLRDLSDATSIVENPYAEVKFE